MNQKRLRVAGRTITRRIAAAARRIAAAPGVPSSVVGGVESRALEDNRRPRPDQPPHGSAALRAGLHGLILHVLKLLESLSTLIALVLVRRHRRTSS